MYLYHADAETTQKRIYLGTKSGAETSVLLEGETQKLR